MMKLTLLTVRTVRTRSDLSAYLGTLVDAGHPLKVIEELRKRGYARWDEGDVITEYTIERDVQ